MYIHFMTCVNYERIKGTPQRSGRVTHTKKKNFKNIFVTMLLYLNFFIWEKLEMLFPFQQMDYKFSMCVCQQILRSPFQQS